MPGTALEHAGATRRFARQALLGLAGLEPADVTGGNLTLPLALSAWLRIAGLSTADARSSLLDLRLALVQVSGLDQATEPVPLLTREPRQALVGLAVYLHGLVIRSAAHAQTSRSAIAEEALELLA